MYFKDNVLIIWKISKNVPRKKWLRGTEKNDENHEKDLLIWRNRCNFAAKI
jgi:hypothetical protein